MTDLNRVVLVGRLTRDAEVKYTAGGQGVCTFSIAVNRSKRVGEQWEEEASFFDVNYWLRNGADGVTKYLLKGKMVGVDGSLRQDRWQKEGQNHSKVEIVATSIQLLGGGSGSGGPSSGDSYGGGGGSRGGYSYGQGGRAPAAAPAPAGDPGAGDGDNFADDIPF